jgi:MFS family permease/quinol monooxygenase YgiN
MNRPIAQGRSGMSHSQHYQSVGQAVTKAPIPSPWSPFHYKVFRLLWIATVVANIGTWMYSTAAAWLMTSLDGDPVMVSLVQVAMSLPMFLFALPAGALADIIDKRRFILALEMLVTVVSVLFAALVSLGLVTPWLLLVFLFLIGVLAAVEAPAWQAIVPLLVSKQDLHSAIAANSVGVNVSRAIGPALAGALIAGFGIAMPFWLDAASNLGVIAVFWWWCPPQAKGHALPAERFIGAIRTGFRYARHNRILRATLARAVGFFLFASAYWALLPLVVRNQIGGGPELYGILLGAIGAGAVSGAFFLPQLKHRIGANGVATAGQAGTALALVLFGLSREPFLATIASLIAGLCWIATLATLNVSAQTALPNWVRARGLAMYVSVFFGTMTIGSVLWGKLADVAGLSLTHLVAAAGALLAIPLSMRWRLQGGTELDLTPSMHWPAPVVSQSVESDAGPVMVTVEYRINPKDRDDFLQAMEAIAAERQRDGAYAWDIFQDTADDSRFVETFFLNSWLEHLRQHQRVTHADVAAEKLVQRYLLEASKVTHFIAAET